VNAVLAHQLAAQNSMASVERLVTLGWGLDGVVRAGVPGAVVELGCHAGHASVWLACCLRDLGSPRQLVLFDGFAGLPPPAAEELRPGRPGSAAGGGPGTPGGRTVELADVAEGGLATSEQDVRDRFARLRLPQPRLVAGWFADTLDELPDRIAFCYLDADFYASTLTVLDAVWPRLSAGGLLVLDDYCDPARDPQAWNGLPVVKRACDQFFLARGLTVHVVPGVAGCRAVGYLHKPKDPT
jgi:O-methyltransferase